MGKFDRTEISLSSLTEDKLVNEGTVAQIERLSLHPDTIKLAAIFEQVIEEIGSTETTAEVIACVLIAQERAKQ